MTDMHLIWRSGHPAGHVARARAHNSDTFAGSGAAFACIDIVMNGNEPSGGGEGSTDIVVDDFFIRPCGNERDAHILQHCTMA